MNRRSFLRGAVALAPAVILTPGLLMPVRPLAYVPKWEFVAVPLAANYAVVSFWMKAQDRAARERIVRAAEDLTLYPYRGIDFLDKAGALGGALSGALFDRFCIEPATAYHKRRLA